MGIFENVLLAVAGIKANRMRSLLTMLGIIIGISSVITINTLSNILTAKIEGIYDSFGGISLVGFRLTRKDDAVRERVSDEDRFSAVIRDDIAERFSDKVDYISFSSGYIDCTTTSHHNMYDVTLYGVNKHYIKEYMFDIGAGRFITDSDCEKGASVCVISDRQAKKLFGSVHGALGKTLSVTQKGDGRFAMILDFTVVGVYEYKVEAVTSMMLNAVGNDIESWNTDVYIPYTKMNRLLDKEDFSNYINVHIIPGLDIDGVATEIKDYLNNTYYRKNDSYNIRYWTQEQEMSMFDEILGTISGVIAVVAGISLLVGGIGVMNIMLVSVTERTREIGVRKTLGAPNSAIRIQFIVESIIICTIGGAIGILLGIGVGNIAGIIVGRTASPDLSIIILSFGFSMAIGMFFGYYPANKAAKLDPIESLRYE